MSTRGQRVCQMNGGEANYLFAIKSFMKSQPYLIMVINLSISLFYFGYLIRIFDESLTEVSNQNFKPINNPVWLSIVTMTTVGYGDFYPKSSPSRLIGILCAFYGVYFVALFLIALTNLLIFDAPDERSYLMILSLSEKEELKMKAINVISSAFRHKQETLINPEKPAWIKDRLITFLTNLRLFNEQAKELRIQASVRTPEDNIRKEIGGMKDSLIDLKSMTTKMNNLFKEKNFKKKNSDKNTQDASSHDESSEDSKSSDAN